VQNAIETRQFKNRNNEKETKSNRCDQSSNPESSYPPFFLVQMQIMSTWNAQTKWLIIVGTLGKTSFETQFTA
jgi:hypothetical protein